MHGHVCRRVTSVNNIENKNRHLPTKAADAQPWEILCVDLIGPYQVQHKGKKPLRLQAVTMIDPAAGWFEVAEIPSKESITGAEQVD